MGDLAPVTIKEEQEARGGNSRGDAPRSAPKKEGPQPSQRYQRLVRLYKSDLAAFKKATEKVPSGDDGRLFLTHKDGWGLTEMEAEEIMVKIEDAAKPKAKAGGFERNPFMEGEPDGDEEYS